MKGFGDVYKDAKKTNKPPTEKKINQAIQLHLQGNIKEARKYYKYCIEQNINDTQIDNLISDIKKISKEMKFISMSRSNDSTTINIDLKPKKFENLTSLSGKIKKKFSNSKVILAYNDDLSL